MGIPEGKCVKKRGSAYPNRFPGGFAMKRRIVFFGLTLAIAVFIPGCGGGDGGSSPSPGTISMNVTDAKPVLPVSDVESVTITFDEVRVHKSGGGWTTLATATQPYSIDLYLFSDGSKTQFVPPVQLESGKYTQVRIGVVDGTIRINGKDYPLEIPSSNLKTDKNFEFDVPAGGAVDITVDFDLSQSIVLTGSGTYQLKPVLHLNRTSQAATIEGTINFGSSTQATVIVIADKNGDGTLQTPDPQDPNTDEEYTRIRILSTDPTPFRVFWLVPNEGYFVQILLGDPQSPGNTYEEFVAATNLPAGSVYPLGGGSPIFP
jgi:hypothetical protein